MINPSGNRSLTFEPEDRCLVIGRGSNRELTAQARLLAPGTLILNFENSPSWVRLAEAQNRLIVTLTQAMPGLGGLRAERRLGFNLLIMDANGVMLSWPPLTLRFSWDCPSHWGLVETKP